MERGRRRDARTRPSGGQWSFADPILAARRDSLFVARRSLRELAGDSQARVREATIHAARMRAVMEAHDVRALPQDAQDVPRRIEQLLLVRAGHLVDDLSPSNAHVMEWLRRIEDGRANLEVHRLREALSSLRPDITLQNDQQVAALLANVIRSVDFGDDAKNVTALLKAGYLSGAPALAE